MLLLKTVFHTEEILYLKVEAKQKGGGETLILQKDLICFLWN